MLLPASSSKFVDTDPPTWVTDWLNKRGEHKANVEKKVQQKKLHLKTGRAASIVNSGVQVITLLALHRHSLRHMRPGQASLPSVVQNDALLLETKKTKIGTFKHITIGSLIS